MISFVIPAFNEEASIDELYGEVIAICRDLIVEYEIVFVDDGSTDGTRRRMENLASSDGRVRVLSFIRNFGKSAAYTAGFDAATGDRVATLDADLQDDPAELPKLIMELERGLDLVVGRKLGRLGNEPHKTVPSRVFNLLNRMLFGLAVHDTNSGYRLMRREVAVNLDLYGDLYRFIPQLAHVGGYRVGEIGVVHRRRKHGASKYDARRFLTGLLDVVTVRFVTGFAQRPLHFFGLVGAVAVLLGGALESYVLAVRWMGSPFSSHLAAIIIGVMLIILGVQSVLTGLVGEMITAQKRRATYTLANDSSPVEQLRAENTRAPLSPH